MTTLTYPQEGGFVPYDPATQPPGSQPPVTDPSRSFLDEARALYPWLPDELLRIYADSWADSGDGQTAWATVRAAPQYDVYFPGNRREDGSLRYSEMIYKSVWEGYEDVISSTGLNPSLFTDLFVDLIEGNVSPDELAAERVDPTFERIVQGTAEIQAAFAEQRDIAITPEAILASALDPAIGDKILERQITMAEIRGEAWQRRMFAPIGLGEDLAEVGMTRSTAQRFFSEASEMLPVLNVLARRHGDPDDTFDLEEFTAGSIFDDPTQRARLRRAVAQERASFTQPARELGYTVDRYTGGLSGLTER